MGFITPSHPLDHKDDIIKNAQIDDAKIPLNPQPAAIKSKRSITPPVATAGLFQPLSDSKQSPAAESKPAVIEQPASIEALEIIALKSKQEDASKPVENVSRERAASAFEDDDDEELKQEAEPEPEPSRMKPK